MLCLSTCSDGCCVCWSGSLLCLLCEEEHLIYLLMDKNRFNKIFWRLLLITLSRMYTCCHVFVCLSLNGTFLLPSPSHLCVTLNRPLHWCKVLIIIDIAYGLLDHVFQTSNINWNRKKKTISKPRLVSKIDIRWLEMDIVRDYHTLRESRWYLWRLRCAKRGVKFKMIACCF